MSENPGLSQQGSKLSCEKKVNAVAIDCPSIDAGADSKFTAHNILLPRNILVVENLCNLDKVGSSSSGRRSNNNTTALTLIISPLKLGGATGSPARVLALL